MEQKSERLPPHSTNPIPHLGARHPENILGIPVADGLEGSMTIEDQNSLNASEHWHRVFEQYSSLKLTKEADRSPALSGMAARYLLVLQKGVSLSLFLIWILISTSMQQYTPTLFQLLALTTTCHLFCCVVIPPAAL
jgi:hypothetical protein